MPSEVMGYDMACQVGKAYNIFPPASWSFFEDLDAITRSSPFFESKLVLSRHSWRH